MESEKSDRQHLRCYYVKRIFDYFVYLMVYLKNYI